MLVLPCRPFTRMLRARLGHGWNDVKSWQIERVDGMVYSSAAREGHGMA